MDTYIEAYADYKRQFDTSWMPVCIPAQVIVDRLAGVLFGQRRLSPSIVPMDVLSWWRQMAVECQAHRRELNAREREFVNAILGWRDVPSEKQLSWLIAIHARLHEVSA